MDFNTYFTRGANGTLKLKNNTQFSHSPHWKQVYTNTVVDSWHVGEIMAAEYTIVIDHGRDSKEILKAVVIAGPNDAGISIVGRANIEEKLVVLDATVDSSTFKLYASPAKSEVAGCRIMFSADYYHTLNDV